MQTGPPPSKKRKRPTKKQIREAQQAAAAAAAAQQRQYMMEQQMTVRVPSANNAHTVERPGIMPQVKICIFLKYIYSFRENHYIK